MSEPVWEGGCFCGAIRYRALGPAWDNCHCHCADCRRSSGAAFVTWASVQPGRFTFTRGEPRAHYYDGRTRTFCPICGTALTFREDALDEIDFTLASLDDPAALTPAEHIWIGDQLSWIQFADDLPTHRRGRS